MSVLTRFYSQNFEDVLLARIFADVIHGFYIDVGCQHEKRDSVTRYFYENGWRGINLDPVVELIEEYDIRERDISLPLAAGAHASRLPFTVVSKSGLSSFHAAHLDCARAHGLEQMEERWVEVCTLNSILDAHMPVQQSITFLKVDVEGHELEVLHGIDLARFRPMVILVETTQPCTTKLVDNFQQISEYLASSSYREVYFDGINTWWLAEEESNRSTSFAYPVGVFDGFSPYQIRACLLDAQAHKNDNGAAQFSSEEPLVSQRNQGAIRIPRVMADMRQWLRLKSIF